MKARDSKLDSIDSFQELYSFLKPVLKQKSISRYKSNETQQTFFVNELFKSICTDEVPHCSQSTASRYINGKTKITRTALRINNKFTDESTFIKKISNIVDWAELRRRNNSSSYTAGTQSSLYRALKRVISTEAQNKTNLSKKNQNNKDIQHSNAYKSSILNEIKKIFISRFPSENEYSKSFTILITPDNTSIDGKRERTIVISSQEWQQLKSQFKKIPMLIARKQFTRQDRYMDYNHPYSRNGSEIPIFDKAIYNKTAKQLNKNTNKMETVFVDENGKAFVNSDGVTIGPDKTVAELNPAIPKYIYFAEVTSWREFNHDKDKTVVKFVTNILSRFDYQIVYRNKEKLGLDEMFFVNAVDETGKQSKFRYVDSIDYMKRLDEFMN